MKVFKIFLYGEDALEDVKKIRADAIASLVKGTVIEWSSDSVSVKKVFDLPAEIIVNECNYFLRTYDPVISCTNPIYTEAKAFIGYA